MANRIDTLTAASATINIDLNSIATGVANGEQSDMIDNNTANSTRYRAAELFFKLRSSATPTGGANYEFYLLRGDAESPSIRTDDAAASKAGLVITNAHLIDVVTNPASPAANQEVFGDMVTEYLGPLGPEWGVGFINESGQTTDSSAGNFIAKHVRYLPEIQ